jgi:hypothetical protein
MMFIRPNGEQGDVSEPVLTLINGEHVNPDPNMIFSRPRPEEHPAVVCEWPPRLNQQQPSARGEACSNKRKGKMQQNVLFYDGESALFDGLSM